VQNADCYRAHTQNAYTSADETCYQLVVPTDKPQLLKDALSVMAQFAFHIRCGSTFSCVCMCVRIRAHARQKEAQETQRQQMSGHWGSHSILLVPCSLGAEPLPHIFVCACVCVCARAYAYVLVCVCACMCACACVRMCACVSPRVRALQGKDC